VCARPSREGKVCVVAGFQGISTDKEITSLGRGGSDTTAVALAAALNADACEIYTDVTGVFTADPRIVPQARKLQHVNFDEMLEMAGAGSKVLALRSVEFARNHNVPIHVRSAFTWEHGHVGHQSQEPNMEDPIISGVVTDMSEAKVTVVAVPDRPGISAALFEPLAAANVNVDMIVQNTSHDGTTDISFTMPKADKGTAEQIVARVAAEIGAAGVEHSADIAKISLVGAGMKTSPGIAAKMFRTLADEGVNIEMISTSARFASAWSHRRQTSSGRRVRCTPRSVSTRARRIRRRCPSASSRRRHMAVAVRALRMPGTLVRS
jgi:aspartate kinase